MRNALSRAISIGAFGRRELRMRVGDRSVALLARSKDTIAASATHHYERVAPGDAAVVLERRDPLTGKWGRLARVCRARNSRERFHR